METAAAVRRLCAREIWQDASLRGDGENRDGIKGGSHRFAFPTTLSVSDASQSPIQRLSCWFQGTIESPANQMNSGSPGEMAEGKPVIPVGKGCPYVRQMRAFD